MKDEEILRLEAYLKQKLSPLLEVRKRPGSADSVEVYRDDEFLGVIFKDDEDPKDISYDFNMAILEMDLPRRG